MILLAVMSVAVGLPRTTHAATLPAQAGQLPPAQPMPPVVRRALESAGVARTEVGTVVVPLTGGRLHVADNAGTALNPASTMKLVTTNAAFGILGEQYRWVTRVYARGPIVGDTLRGDLVLRGGGDPKLVIEDLQVLVAQLRATGLRRIEGDLLVDGSLYAHSVHDEAAPIDGDVTAPYNVTPHAALINFNATRFVFDPVTRTVVLDPPLDGVRVQNDVQVRQGRCRRSPDTFAIAPDDSGRAGWIKVRGQVWTGCGLQERFGAVFSHLEFIHSIFSAAWRAAGGELLGGVHERPVPTTARPLLDWSSPRTLADVVQDINKFSNNVMTRMVMLQMAATRLQRPATPEDGARVVRDWYASRALPLRSLILDNGSGLSREGRISAADLASVLVSADRAPYGPAFEQSLPLVGHDGTMRWRLRNDPVAGEAWIKTGTLDEVRAIAGYVTAASGHRYAVVMLVNSRRAQYTHAAQDALLRWVHAAG